MDLDTEDLEGLLLQAAVKRDAAFAAALCKCDASAQLSSGAVKMVLRTAAFASQAYLRSAEDAQKAAAAAGQGASAGAGSGAGVGPIASAAAGAAAAAGTQQGGKGGRHCKKARRRGKM
jgi:hypothetical protein